VDDRGEGTSWTPLSYPLVTESWEASSSHHVETVVVSYVFDIEEVPKAPPAHVADPPFWVVEGPFEDINSGQVLLDLFFLTKWQELCLSIMIEKSLCIGRARRP